MRPPELDTAGPKEKLWALMERSRSAEADSPLGVASVVLALVALALAVSVLL